MDLNSPFVPTLLEDNLIPEDFQAKEHQLDIYILVLSLEMQKQIKGFDLPSLLEVLVRHCN